MASNKRRVPSPVTVLEKLSAATARWRSRPWIVALSILTVLPFGLWVLGSGIVWAVPDTYRSSALLHTGESVPTSESVKSPAVMEQAVRNLAGQRGTRDPMATYSLWSSVTVTPQAAELVKLEARSGDAEEARRMVLAVAHAWRSTCEAEASGQAPAVVYVDPPETAPQRVPDETRLALGLAGSASVCLLLCIPMLLFVERRVPVKASREALAQDALPA